jgi:hypothetical protein
MENRFMVTVRAGQVVIMLPPQGSMSKDDAKNLAAMPVAMPDLSACHVLLRHTGISAG